MYGHIRTFMPNNADFVSSRLVAILSRSTLIIADIIVVAATWLNRSVRSSALSDVKETNIPSFAKVLLIDGECMSQCGVVGVT